MYFLLLDRQNEYIHLLDFQWKRQLKDDQAKARSTKLVNKMLLQNILPQHVADVFISRYLQTLKSPISCEFTV